MSDSAPWPCDGGCTSFGIRSRAEGDKRIVPENHGDGKRARILVGNHQKATRREYRYWFQHLVVSYLSCHP
jgi:hypothetical protein